MILAPRAHKIICYQYHASSPGCNGRLPITRSMNFNELQGVLQDSTRSPDNAVNRGAARNTFYALIPSTALSGMFVFNKIIKSLTQICSLYVNNHLGNRKRAAGTLTCAELFSSCAAPAIRAHLLAYYHHSFRLLQPYHYVIVCRAAGQQTAQLPKLAGFICPFPRKAFICPAEMPVCRSFCCISASEGQFINSQRRAGRTPAGPLLFKSTGSVIGACRFYIVSTVTDTGSATPGCIPAGPQHARALLQQYFLATHRATYAAERSTLTGVFRKAPPAMMAHRHKIAIVFCRSDRRQRQTQAQKVPVRFTRRAVIIMLTVPPLHEASVLSSTG